MFNVRKNKKGFTLVELIVVIAILAILAGTAAGIGVTLINKNTNKAAKSEVNLLVDDFKQFVLEKESDGESLDATSATVIQELLDGFQTSLNLDSKQKDKIKKPTAGWPTVDENDKADLPKAGEHKYYVFYTLVAATTDKPASFTITFKCAVKGAIAFDNENNLSHGGTVIAAAYTYAASIG